MFKEHLAFILVSIASAPISSPVVYQHLIATYDNEPVEEVNSGISSLMKLSSLMVLRRTSLINAYK